MGNYAVAVFMDAEGAFSHTSSQIICEEVASKGVLRPVVDWMMDLLGIKKVTSNLGSVGTRGSLARELHKGVLFSE